MPVRGDALKHGMTLRKLRPEIGPLLVAVLEFVTAAGLLIILVGIVIAEFLSARLVGQRPKTERMLRKPRIHQPLNLAFVISFMARMTNSAPSLEASINFNASVEMETSSSGRSSKPRIAAA